MMSEDQVVIEECCCSGNPDCCSQHSQEIVIEYEHARDGFRFGRHVSKLKTVAETIQQSGNSCCQFFLSGNIRYDAKVPSASDKKRTLDLCLTESKTYYVHVPYVAYLGRPINQSTESASQVAKSIQCVQNCVDAVSGTPGCAIMHAGTVGTTELLAQRLNELNIQSCEYSNPGCHLAVETGALRKGELFSTWDDIRKLYEAVDFKIGICVDTQHAFAAGLCDFSNHESVVKLFDHVEWTTGGRPTVFHLNDSKGTCGCHVDKHMLPGTGKIWSELWCQHQLTETTESLRALVELCTEHSIDLLQETQGVMQVQGVGTVRNHSLLDLKFNEWLSDTS